MARSKSKTGSDLGSYWTENVTWPLLCPYNVPVTLLPREEDPPVTSEISWLETPEEVEDGGDGRERNLQAGMLMTLMRERKKEESFKWNFPMLLEEEDEEE
jgi:hypothetical protein